MSNPSSTILDGTVVQSALHLLQAVGEADVERRRALGHSGVRITALGPWELKIRLDFVLRIGKIILRLVLEQVL